MTALNTAIDHDAPSNNAEGPRVSPPVAGKDLVIGEGFTAQSFRAREVDAAMDPLVMVDHYVMTESTFGAHPHAGLSAVSLLFQDGSGRFHNRDSLGNDFDLQPGDLYWLKAGSGAVHDEAPRPGSRIHGLQVFVNLPERQRRDAPMSVLVRGDEMPVLTGEDYRVRIALGSSNGVTGVAAPDASMTILDGTVNGNGTFVHRLAANRNAWLQAIDGDLSVSVAGSHYTIREGEALTVSSPAEGEFMDLQLASTRGAATHFALFAAEPIREPYVQQGPFVMGSAEEIDEVKAAYEAGELGEL
ncbi:pirin family protein [Pseudohaliea sp.]|uniref:pirin family protein n=1 Tax=Pseudohaliea sp. TaxID=2740289 RepID=UPI0032ECAE2A